MKRTIYKSLIKWKKSRTRKPLILQGARQTGKTYVLVEFGKNEFNKLHHFNFQMDKNLSQVFEGSLEPHSIIETLQFISKSTIDIENDLLFFDEIQDCPRALTSLKYFCEDIPQLAICSAGSLLGVSHPNSSFPVGKVEFLNLYPMSFIEFLTALHEQTTVKFLESITINTKINEAVHGKILQHYKEYLCVGGMPEVVSTYQSSRDNKFIAFINVRQKQQALLNSYRGDFAKYSERISSSKIISVFESIPAQLSRENKRFKPSLIESGVRFSKLTTSIDWLLGAGLLIKTNIINSGEIPFRAFVKTNCFKLYFFDIGLLGALAELSPNVIYKGNDLFKTFKGAFVENYVAQEFVCSGNKNLYSWANNTSEIEFVFEKQGVVLPVEVKSGLSGKLKSLNVFEKKYKTEYRTRISAYNLQINNETGFHNYPLYMAAQFPLM